jgi:putative hemolysin
MSGLNNGLLLNLGPAMKVIEAKDFEVYSPLYKGERGHRLAEFVMRLLAIDRINQVYDNSGAYTGTEFTSRLLDDLGVNYVIGNAERLKMLPEGPFITVSNHPYGGLDGIMSIDLMARIRPDYRFMVNKMISKVKTLQDNIISVIPAGNKKTGVQSTNIKGIRDTLEHLHNGHPVGFFPSGAVSDFRLRDFRIRDRAWQSSILHMIYSMKIPVLPLRFFDKNSLFFYFLGFINWRVRALRLPYEVFNKRKQEPRIGIGNIITVEEREQFTDAKAFGDFLRKCVYEMPLPTSFIPRKMFKLEGNQYK